MSEVALSARQSRMSAATDLSKVLVGLLVNSRAAAKLVASDDFEALSGDFIDDAQGRAIDRAVGAYSIAVPFAVNTTAVIPTLNAVEGRPFALVGSVAAVLVGLLTNSRNAYFDLTLVDWCFSTGDHLSAVPGRLATAVGGPYVQAVAVGIEPAGAAVYPVAVGSGTYAAKDERYIHLAVRSLVTGILPAAAAGSQEMPVAAGVLNADFDERYFGLATRSVLSAYNGLAAVGSRNVLLQASAAAIVHDERLMHLLATACLCGANTGAAAGSRDVPIEARAPGTTPLDERLNGIYALAFLRALNSGAAAGSQGVAVEGRAPGTTPLDERLYGLYSLAFVRGINSGAAAGSQGVAVEARPTLTSETFTGLTDLYTSSVVRLVNAALSTQTILQYGDSFANISGRLATAGFAAYSAAIAVGIDNTGAAVLRPVEARTGLVGFTENFYRLQVGALCYGYNAQDGFSGRVQTIAATSASASASEPGYSWQVSQSRESGFAAARRGKRFNVTNSTVATAITAQLAFVATTPTLMLRVDSAAIRAIIRSFSISLANTPGGVTTVIAIMDTADRYSAAGTAVTPQNTNEESVTAAVSKFYENPTASAAGGGTRVLGHWTIPASVGSILDLEFEDSDLLGPTAATFMLYVFAPVTAPQLYYHGDLEEVA
jgi:hypothetical protein